MLRMMDKPVQSDLESHRFSQTAQGEGYRRGVSLRKRDPPPPLPDVFTLLRGILQFREFNEVNTF